MSFATKEQLQELTAFMAGQLNIRGVGVYSPVGTIIAYMGTTAPKDYLACDGTVYNIADYTLLANHIAANFGSVNFFGGDGETTFAVPDLRGEFLRGTGTNSHANQGGGANVGIHQNGTEHRYFGMDTFQNVYWRNIVDNVYRDALNKDSTITHSPASEDAASHHDSSVSATNVTHYTSRPTNTSVLYCIAYRDSMEDIVSAVLERLQGG